LQKIILAMLSLTMFVGLAMSADPLEERSKGVLFNYEDSISGSGNFVSNNKIVAQGPHADPRVLSRLADVYLQKMTHGSGSIERESIITSTESRRTQVDPDVIYTFGLIAALDNNSMVFGPQTMSIGTGYYDTHPVNFNSLLGDKTQIKNYASKTSMGQEINYAHGIYTDQVASVEDDYYDTGVAKSLTRSLMNLNGGVTSGTAHLEMLQGGSRKSKSAWSNPDIDVDQVYTGTFEFATKMNLTVPVYKSVSEDYWLPCCSGGWEDMMNSDKKGFGTDAKGIFDCTCPKGLAKDQYPQEG
jgi:hypothetical protein